MASQLEQLIANVRNIGQGAKRTSANLQDFDMVFTKHVDSVTNAIGGGTRRADQNVIAALELARKATKEASVALDAAARACEEYATSI